MKTLSVPESEDFELQVMLEGEVIPQQVDLDVDGQRIPLVKQDAVALHPSFPQCAGGRSIFRFAAEGFQFQRVHPEHRAQSHAPGLQHDAAVSALSRPAEQPPRTMHGDVTVPAGTRITWTVNTRSTDRLDLAFDDTTLHPRATGR